MGKILLNAFNMGGISESKYTGIKNSWARLIGWNIHSVPGLLTANQKMSKDSGVVIDEFCKAPVDCSNGIRYFFSYQSGKIWQEKAGTYTLVYTVVPNAGSAIITGAIEYQGFLYFFTQSRVHRIPIDNSKADGASAWTTNAVPNWGEMNLDQATIGGTGATAYSLTNAVNEGATHKQTFIPVNATIEGFRVKVVATGTSVDWTLALHDSANNLIGSATITGANMATGLKYFTFTTPVAVTPGASYHVHLYASAITGTPTADTVVATDWEGGQLSIFTISDSTYHPAVIVNLVLYIGDRNYVHQVDNSTNTAVFSQAALDIQPGYRITCLGKMGTDLLLGTIITTSIAQCEIFRWNTYSNSFSSSDTVYEPGINCFLATDNFVIVSAGVVGNLYYYNGAQLQFYKKIPGNYSPTSQCIVNPNATDLFNGTLPIFGVSNVVGNPCDQGIYSLFKYALTTTTSVNVLNLEWPISKVDVDGYNIVSGIEIGFVLVSGNYIFQSWRRSTVVTITIASPGVVTYASHGLSNGDGIVFSTTGGLPTGLTAGTTYYVRSTGTDTLNLYDTSAHAVSGGATGLVATSSTQSGVHTALTVGIDKLDYSNKIVHPIAESRLIVPLLGAFTTFNEFAATYETSMPTGTSIVFKTSKNGAAFVTLDPAAVDDSDRNQVKGDASRADARTLQLRMEAVSSGNTSPSIQEVIIDVT